MTKIIQFPITCVNREKFSPEDKENITAQALDLSLRYNFVTPLTSMVVTKPETEDEDETLIADKLTEGTWCHNSK